MSLASSVSSAVLIAFRVPHGTLSFHPTANFMSPTWVLLSVTVIGSGSPGN